MMMIASNIDRIMKEAEKKANSIDKVLSTMPPMSFGMGTGRAPC